VILGRLLLFLALLALAPAAHAATPAPGFGDTLVTAGLSQPTAIAFLPDQRLLVTEKGGTLRLVTGGTATTLVTIPVCTTTDGAFTEMGLLGVAVDPNFETNGFIYLYRTKPGATSGCGSAGDRFNQVVRVTMAGGTVDPASLAELLSGMRTHTGNHNGGTVRVGPDGKLYVSVGDSGLGDENQEPGQAANPYAQDLNALEGKVLRLELDGSPAAGNPFLGQPGKRGEVWAYGFRNPWRFGFDPVTGLPWLGDVGQHTIEELDIVVAGGNYAWPHCEGTLPPGCRHANDVDPIFEYPHSGANSLGEVIIGGDFAPSGFGPFAGHYFFADPGGEKIYRAVPNAAHDGLDGPPTDFVTGANGYPVDIVFGPDGGLYYVSFNFGEVRRVGPLSLVRPLSATPVRASLVLAYASCLSPNRQHGPPLSSGSCHPPQPVSDQLTVGTNDSNGQETNSVGSVRFGVVQGNPATEQNEADVRISTSVTDVRRRSGLGDYTGQLRVNPSVRITDRNNGPSGTEQATTKDIPFPITVPCLATSSSSIGGECSLSSSFNAIAAGSVVERKRAVWQLAEIRVFDSGPDGQVATSGDNELFARQGIFIP
jgi:glucose/arabinose dehydrogenase